MRFTKILISSAIALSFSLEAGSAFAQSDLNRGPLNIFPRENLLCGGGWRFPGLIWGDRPVHVCMLKTKRRNVFGGDF